MMLTGDDNFDVIKDQDSYNFTTPDTQIKWGPWKGKFAFLPVKIHTKLSGHNSVWFKIYYERVGRSLYMTTKQRGTIFDIIKENRI